MLFYSIFFTAKLIADENAEMEERKRLDIIELNRLEAFAQEDAKFFKSIDEQLECYDAEIRRYEQAIQSMDEERAMVAKTAYEFEEHKRLKMQKLTENLNEARSKNMELQMLLSEKENEVRKCEKEANELETTLKRQSEELAKLRQMRDNDPAQVDEILKEKQENLVKKEALIRLNEEYIKAQSVAEEELVTAKKDYMQSVSVLKECEERLSKLGIQKTELTCDSKTKHQELDKLKQDLSLMEDERIKITTCISSNELLLSGTLAKELKEQSRIERTLTSILESLHRLINERLVELREHENLIDSKTAKLNSLTTRNEFMQNEIHSLEDQAKDARKRCIETERKISELGMKDISIEVEEREREIENLRSQIEQVNVELQFLKDHNMLGPDGLLKPLLIANTEAQVEMDSLVEKLGINEFLTRVQSEPDVNKIIVQLVEKISQILQLIHEAKQLELRYSDDSNKAAVIIEKLKMKNNESLNEIDQLQTFKRLALVQIGLNQLQATKGVNLVLQGLEFRDQEVEDLLAKLSFAEKAKVQKINLSNCRLVDFELSRFVMEFPNLRELNVRGNPDLTSMGPLVKYIKTQMEGVTGVYCDDKVLIANSGLQVRLTVYH